MCVGGVAYNLCDLRIHKYYFAHNKDNNITHVYVVCICHASDMTPILLICARASRF